MFANDLSQLSLGAYSGAINPFTSPYAGSMQTAINPLGNPFAQQSYGGVPNYAAIAQQHQLQQQIQQLQALASILASQSGNPQASGFAQQNPFQNQPFQNQPFQNQPWQQPNLLQNPLIAASLQNPYLLQQLALQQNPFAQQGFPLAPQSWVGQQIHSHHQMAGRGIY